MANKWNQYDFGTVTRAAAGTFNSPLSKLKGPLIFTCSTSDFFHPDADEWREEAWDIIRRTQSIYQILTKRIELVPERLPVDWGDGWDNVWLGVSVESERYLGRVFKLQGVPAAKRFISYEPALDGVNFGPTLKYMDWLISGGESGYTPRPASLDWFRSVRAQCDVAGIPYFHKQHGGTRMIDGVAGGRVLDGRTHDGIPAFEVKKKVVMVQGSLF
jgi:protein gp37